MAGCECRDNFSMIDGGDEFKAFPGLKGDDGTTFYPHVSGDGTLSWTNNGGLPNPPPVNIKGPPGEPQTPSDAEPLMDGAASAGISTDYARGDHRHPSDYNKAPVITDTASGSIASFPDGANDLPLESIVLQITPVQGSGTPTPDSPLPISGRTGLCLTQAGTNLFDEDGADWKNGYFLNDSGNEASSNSYKYCQTYFPIPSETSICVQYNKGYSSSAALTICWYDRNKNFISRSILIGATATTGIKTGRTTTPVGAKYYRMSLPRFDSTDIMVEIGSEASSYAEYAGKIVYIDWSTIAGTIYGGALEWLGNNQWKLDARPYYASYNGESLVGPWVSSMDVYTPGTTPTIGAQVVDIGGAIIEYTLTILNSDIMTTLGVNYIFAECEPVSLAYRADTKLYIQKINAPTDSDMIADTQIASGKYFIVGGNLYKSTTTIPAGDAIIPGTNCQQTNLAEALNALNT